MANEDIASIIKEQIKKFGDDLKVEQTGIVTEAGDGVVRAQGLSNVKANEIVQFQNDVYGLALNLEEDTVGMVILGDYLGIKEGDEVIVQNTTFIASANSVEMIGAKPVFVDIVSYDDLSIDINHPNIMLPVLQVLVLPF